MRYKIYQFLVNRHNGIKERYHKMHDKAVGLKKLLSWVYLIWLNLCYYLFFCRFLDYSESASIFENKKLIINESESAAACRNIGAVDSMVERLSAYDLISFDIFDTLIFRPFSSPEDLFYYVGDRLEFMNFKQIRVEMESMVRSQSLKERKTAEVTLREIWEKLSEETGIPLDEGMAVEVELEKEFCYANPFMYEVYQKLLSKNKRIIAVSDMYLDSKILGQILKKCGYSDIEDIYVSCEYRKGKADKGLYSIVKEKYNNCRCIHVGDNIVSDIRNSYDSGFAGIYYPNVNLKSSEYRAYDMSPVIGGGYRGIVNNHLYCGLRSYSMEYEYGFIYGGLFVLGYCRFIHNYAEKNNIDKVLFLSRDGHILSKIYKRLYDDETEYVYWSRGVAAKLMADNDRYDYFRRFIYHKVNKKISVKEILKSAGIEEIAARLPEGISETDFLTDANADMVKRFIIDNWSYVAGIYSLQSDMMKEYYGGILKGCRRACAVDIGWAGSGAVSLDFLCRNVWNIPCSIFGLVAGTNTVHNAEPDAAETFLQSGRLTSYLFSQSDNRDVMKRHDLNKGFNLYWELLLSSPTGSFKGFERDKDGGLTPVLAEPDVNKAAVNEIWKGISDFVEEYNNHFGKCRINEHISGRDAYAPMLAAAGHREKYLKSIISNININVDVV